MPRQTINQNLPEEEEGEGGEGGEDKRVAGVTMVAGCTGEVKSPY